MLAESIKTLGLGLFLVVVYFGLSVVFEDRFWLQVAESVR